MGEVKSFIFSGERIIDRKKEQKIILDEIAIREADLTIIYSESGVGKSALTARIGRTLQGMQSVVATSPPENKNSNCIEGAFLSNIFNAVVRTMQRQKKEYPKCTLEYYLSHNKSAVVKKKALEKMFDGIESSDISQSVGWSFSKYVLTRIFKLYDYDPSAMLTLRDRDSMLIASDYVKYVLNELPILLVVDNIQNIDPYSMQLMIDWVLVHQSSSYFLWEYTISDLNDTSLMDFVKYLKDYSLKVKLVKLPHLQTEDALHAVELVHPQAAEQVNFLSSAKRFYEANSGGSMQKLLDFSLRFQDHIPIPELYDPTFDRIQCAKSESKYILSIIILHGGRIIDTHLRGILENSVDPIVLDLDLVLQTMEFTDLLILQKSNAYQLSHAQIGDSWNEHKPALRRFDLLAQRNCILYYEQILESMFTSIEKKEDAVLFLMKAYAKVAPEKMEGLVQQLSTIIFDRLKPEQVWNYLSEFLDCIQGNEALYVPSLHQIVRFCFDHNLYKNCLYVLERLSVVPEEGNSDFCLIYRINCMEYLESHDKAIKLCLQCLTRSTTQKNRYYYLLLLMGCYRSLNKINDVLDCVKQITEIPDYDSYLEYGYFLRLSEIYMSRAKALPYVYQSVQFFQARGMDVQEIKSGITYSFLLAVVGDLSDAYQILNHYAEKAAPLHLFANVFELNKASILLLQKLYGQEVEMLLKKAELATTSPFDNLLILTMQLINYTECSNEDMVKSLIPRIKSLLEHEKDKHLIALVTYDLYYYYTLKDDISQAQQYHYQAKMASSENETVRFLLQEKTNPATPNLFRTRWCIGFTFFWNIDYDSDILLE